MCVGDTAATTTKSETRWKRSKDYTQDIPRASLIYIYYYISPFPDNLAETNLGNSQRWGQG